MSRISDFMIGEILRKHGGTIGWGIAFAMSGGDMYMVGSRIGHSLGYQLMERFESPGRYKKGTFQPSKKHVSVRTPVRPVGPVNPATYRAAARGSGLLMAGFLLYSLRPSFQFLQGEEIVH